MNIENLVLEEIKETKRACVATAIAVAITTVVLSFLGRLLF